MNSSDFDRRNIASSMRKSVENLVISSQDAIGQSISQALSFSGVITQQSNVILEEARSLSRSPSPALRNTDSGQSEGSNNDKTSFQSDGGGGDGSSGGSADVILALVPVRLDNKVSSPTPTKTVDGGSVRSKKKSWYSSLYPTYKNRSDDFKRIFKEVPDDERLIVDYSCALQKDILAHGRLYASQNYLCFYANIFGWETTLMLQWKDVTAITKEKTALVIPNAILISTESEKNFLASFSGRDKAYLMLFRIWQNALMDQPLSTNEIWQWVHSCYGDELGFNSEDEGREALPPPEELGETSSMEAAGAESREDVRLTRDHSHSHTQVTNGDDLHDGREEEALLLTDMSDTSDSEPDKPLNGQPSTCVCSTPHEGKEVLNAQFAINIDQLFTLIFTASKTYLELMATRNARDLVQSGWQDQPDTGRKSRQISYRVAIASGPFGPKEVHVTETQVMNACTRPGVLYSIDITTENGGIPYADHFTVETHYCLTRVSHTSTTVLMCFTFNYKKSVMSFIRGVIEKSATAGIEQYVKVLESALNDAAGGEGSSRGRHRRRRTHASTLEPTLANVVQSVRAGLSPRPGQIRPPPRPGPTAPAALRPYWLIALVLLLCVANAALYWRIRVVEQQSYVDERAIAERMLSLSASQTREWSRVLNSHASRQRDEQRAWAHELKDVLDTLRQTEQSMKALLQKTTKDSTTDEHLEL